MLMNALEEMRKACPDIQYTFMFNKNGEIVAGDKGTPEKVITRVKDAFADILERAEAIGGVESATIKGEKGTVTLSSFGENYLATVTSEKADMNYVNTLTRVLIPTVLGLMEKLTPTPTEKASPPLEELELEPLEAREETMEKPAEEAEKEEPKEAQPQPETPRENLNIEPHAIQLLVENLGGFSGLGSLGGLLTPSDTVRVDNETLSEWENMFGKPVEFVEIETFHGKTLRCKVKPIKDSKYHHKGVVQIPEKAQTALETKKGEPVKVKPIIE